MDEWANASEASGSDINLTATRTANTIDAQIQPGVIDNNDINASAAIVQSKLSMSDAQVRANDTISSRRK